MQTKERTAEIVKEFGGSDKNTGASEVQIALISDRVKYLTTHLQQNPKDNHTKRGLHVLLGKQRKLLKYLKNTKLESYRGLIAKLGIKDRV